MGGHSVAPTAAERLVSHICADKLAKAERHAVKAGLLTTSGLVHTSIAATSLVR